MLQITPAAAEAISDLTQSSPGSAGVRVCSMPETSTNGSGPVAVFDFYPAAEPDAGDEVVEESGAQVFLEPKVVPYLEDKLLDAEVDGEQVRFTVEPQA